MPREVESEISSDERIRALCKALLACCPDEELLLRFLRDLLTEAEIKTVANRWAIAELLLERRSQSSVAQELRVSTRTVNDVAHWIGLLGTGGYGEVFDRLRKVL